MTDLRMPTLQAQNMSSTASVLAGIPQNNLGSLSSLPPLPASGYSSMAPSGSYSGLSIPSLASQNSIGPNSALNAPLAVRDYQQYQQQMGLGDYAPLSQEEMEMEVAIKSEMGTEDQLLNFFAKYKNHKRYSSKCALDGRYFWKVLAPYAGLVESELVIRINQGPIREVNPEEMVASMSKSFDYSISSQDDESIPVRNFHAAIFFDPSELAKTKNAGVRYRLIKVIMDISSDPESNTGSVHSNLIYIDTKKKEVVRFEPLFDEYYTDPINTMMAKYFKDLLPQYSFRMLKEHPQLPSTDSCPSKGMCAAYVLKKAMMVVTGNDRPLDRDYKDEERKIMIFADAIETEYGDLPDAETMESGVSVGFSTGPVVGTPYGYPGLVTPTVYPGLSMYGPEYYGFVRGPRFGRGPGWGWGPRRFHHWGTWSQEWGANDTSKISNAVSKAKASLKSNANQAKAHLQNLGLSHAQKAIDSKQAQVSQSLSQAQWTDSNAATNAKTALPQTKAQKILGIQNQQMMTAPEHGKPGSSPGAMSNEDFYEMRWKSGAAPTTPAEKEWRIKRNQANAAMGPKTSSVQSTQNTTEFGTCGQGEFGMCGRQEYGCGCTAKRGQSNSTGLMANSAGEHGPYDRDHFERERLERLERERLERERFGRRRQWYNGRWEEWGKADDWKAAHHDSIVQGSAVGATMASLMVKDFMGTLIGAAYGGLGSYLLGDTTGKNQKLYQYEESL